MKHIKNAFIVKSDGPLTYFLDNNPHQRPFAGGLQHLFEGSHGAVRTIVAIDATKVVCADDTGMRAYSTSTGKELFRMEGFEMLHSICMFHDKLYTDGMKGYISIHDFTVEEGDDFELEMPEYRD